MANSIRELIAVDSESTYGTDPTSGDPSELLSCYSVDITPVFSDVPVDRKTADGFANGQQMLRIGSHVDVSFEFPLLGKESAAGDPPPIIGTVFKAANFEETVNASTDVTYTLIYGADQTKVPSMTVRYYLRDDESGDYYLHTITGVRGTLTFTMEDESDVRCQFQGIGTFSEMATSTTSPTLPSTYNGGKDPLAAQGMTVSYDSTDYDARSVDFSTGYSIDRYDVRTETNRLKKATLYLADGDYPTSSVTWGEEGTWGTIIDKHKPAADRTLSTATFETTVTDGTDTVLFTGSETAVGMYSKSQQGGRYAYDAPLTHMNGLSIEFT
jgi:hypothetical protein